LMISNRGFHLLKNFGGNDFLVDNFLFLSYFPFNYEK
jgi:hypothetical protein